MKRLLYVLLISCISFSAFATTHTITVASNVFNPSSLSVSVGDTILWTWISGTHTTTSTTIPAGAASWNSPMSISVQLFQYVVTVPGTYNYKCTPHASMGMVASFVATSTGLANINNPDLSVRINAEKQLMLTVTLPKSVNVNFSVVDVLGRTVIAENHSMESAGIQDYNVSVADLNTGYYFVRLLAGDKALTRRIYIN